jgi:hypothetical protein
MKGKALAIVKGVELNAAVHQSNLLSTAEAVARVGPSSHDPNDMEW